MRNRNKSAVPQEWEAYAEGLPPGFSKHEAASLRILCSLLTVRGNATDDNLTIHAMQLADLWLEKVEVGYE